MLQGIFDIESVTVIESVSVLCVRGIAGDIVTAEQQGVLIKVRTVLTAQAVLCSLLRRYGILSTPQLQGSERALLLC